MEQNIYSSFKVISLVVFCIFYQGIPSVLSCGFQYIAVQNKELTILSPNYPGPPPYRKNCFYEIAFPRNSHHEYYLEIKWEQFDLVATMPNCNGNFVEIEIGNAHIGRICGNSVPHPIYSLQETVRLKLTTDGVSSSGGFKLTYTLRSKANGTLMGNRKYNMCSSLSLASGGLLFTEPWPPRIWEDTICTYTIRPPIGYATRISIMNTNMIQAVQGKPCENRITVRGVIDSVQSLIYSSICKDLRGVVIESTSSEILVTIESGIEPVDYTGYMIGFITFESNGDVNLETTSTPSTSDRSASISTAGALLGTGVAVLVCILILVFVLWKRRKALNTSSDVPCNPNRRIPHSNPGYASEPEVQVVTQRAPPSYAEPTASMDEPPPPYTFEDASRTNPTF